jgi:hypothetical protein
MIDCVSASSLVKGRTKVVADDDDRLGRSGQVVERGNCPTPLRCRK